MGIHRKFNFDQYVDELLVEALSLTQMQDQLKQAGLDPAKYDQKHFLFLVGLLNSNQGVEVYDELIHKIKDKGLLSSLMSVSVNDRRSDKPTIDLEKVGKALEHPEDPEQLRAIIAGQRREIPVEKEVPQYDSSKLKEFLSKNNSEDLLEILIKLKAEVDNTLQQFITEYQQSDEEIKRYVKVNAHRATEVLQLAGILHEAKSKSLNPFNASTSLKVDDLRKEADFYNLEENMYIIRTTYPDDPNKSIKLNLKFGQGNRFGLCISSKTNNYYMSFRVEDFLTTYFVYRLSDPTLDQNDINNYNIAIIDSILDPDIDEDEADNYGELYSINPVATLVDLDPLKFQYDNTDTRLDNEQQIYNRLEHIFQEDNLPIKSRNDNGNYTLNKVNFRKIFKPFELSPHEIRLKEIIDYSTKPYSSSKDTGFEDDFLSLEPKDQIVLLIAGSHDHIDKDLFNKLSPEVRDFYVKNMDAVKDHIYDSYNQREKQIYKKNKIPILHKKYEHWLGYTDESFYQSDFQDQEFYKEIYPSSMALAEINNSVDINIINETPELYKKIVEPQIKYRDLIKKEIMQDVDGDGIYHGNLDLTRTKTLDYRGNETTKRRDFFLNFFLPDLSGIIVKGDFKITNMKLTSLNGCPKVVMGKFIASNNKLKSLEGGPEIVGDNYDVQSNDLETLKGCASVIKNVFNIRNNKKLKNLKGCPEYIRDLLAGNCGLESLEGGPKRVTNCDVNANKLTSLEHGPEIVMEQFRFGDNPLTSIKGYPKEVYSTDIEYIMNPSLTHIVKELGIDHITPYYLSTSIMKNLNIYDINQMTRTELIRSFDSDYARVDKAIESKTHEAINQYIQKRTKINKESLLYSLMKSYLLRS